MSTPTGAVPGATGPRPDARPTGRLSRPGVVRLDDDQELDPNRPPRPTFTINQPPRPTFTNSQKWGLWLLVVITLMSVVPFGPTPDTSADGSEQVGPPAAVIVLDLVLALAILVAIALAFRRRSRLAVRIACGLAVFDAVTALPAFFADQPAWVVIMAAFYVIATAVAVVLALRAPRASLDAAV